MSLQRLDIRGLRNLAAQEIAPGPAINWLFGANGAGKTSVVEGIYILARGRSFRSSTIAPVIQHGAEALSVVARLHPAGATVGVERRADGWRGRIDQRDCQRVSEFAARLPLVLIEPDSHRLVDGGPEHRRHYLDWLLFHVEHDYLVTWQRFARLLRHRNAALKGGAADRVLDALEPELVRTAERINALRAEQTSTVAETLQGLLATLGFDLPGPLALKYRPGHGAERSLSETLAAYRKRDRERGFTRHGPHRAELVVTCDGHPAASEMSRGQQKLLAVLLLLAHLQRLQRHAETQPLLLLDDPVSELDQRHLSALLDWLAAQPMQTWITATTEAPVPATMFHVEQGRLRAVV